jgi:Flp pilus assembly protein CpaB
VAGEAIEVLAVDRTGGGASPGGATAPSGSVGLVLLVTLTDAERLAFASAFATLSIAVRGPTDLAPGEAAFTVPVTAGR